MSPERRVVVNGQTIEKFYWAGAMVCYVDSHRTKDSFAEACHNAGWPRCQTCGERLTHHGCVTKTGHHVAWTCYEHGVMKEPE